MKLEVGKENLLGQQRSSRLSILEGAVRKVRVGKVILSKLSTLRMAWEGSLPYPSSKQTVLGNHC